MRYGYGAEVGARESKVGAVWGEEGRWVGQSEWEML